MTKEIQAGNSLGQQLLAIMQQRGIRTYSEFADLLRQYPGFEGLHFSTVSRWINNKKVPDTKSAHIALQLLTARHPMILTQAVLERELSLLNSKARKIAHLVVELYAGIERLHKSLQARPTPPSL